MNYRIVALLLILLTAMTSVGKNPALMGILPFLLILWTATEMIACYRKRIVVEPIIFGLLLANCTWWFLSVTWSESPSATLIAYYIPASILAGYLLVTLWQACSEKFTEHADTVVIIFATISALYAIYQVINGQQAQSLMANRNSHAAFLNIILFILYFKLLDRGSTSTNKPFFYLIFVVISTAMFSTGGRGAMIAFILSLGLILVVLHRKITQKERLFFLGLPLSGFIFSAVLANSYSITANNMASNSVHRITTLANIVVDGGAHDKGLMERFSIWKDSLNLIDPPNLLGHGLGTFWALFNRVRDPLVTPRVWYVHSDLLQIWIEVGLVGLILFVGLFLYISFRSMHLFAGNGLIYRDRLSLATVVAAIVSVLIHSLVTFNFYIPIILFLIGFLIAKFQTICARYNQNRAVSLVPSNNFSRNGYAILIISLMLVLAQFSATYSVSSLLLENARNELAAGKIESGFRKLNYSASLSPNIDPFHRRQAEALTFVLKKSWSEELFVMGKNSYKSCIDANKYRVMCYTGLAELLQLHPEPELYYSRIEQLYKKSLSYDPSHPIVLANFANFYMHQDDLQSAYHVLKGTEDFKMMRWEGELSYLITYFQLLKKLNKPDQMVPIKKRLKKYSSVKPGG